MNLFDIFAKISLNSEEFNAGITDADEKGKTFSEKLKKGLETGAKVGGAAIAAVGAGAVALGKSFVNGMQETAAYGDEVDKMSQKLGLSKQAYQEWDYVLGQSGTDISSMSTGLKTLTNKLDDAKNGGEDAQGMFSALGLSLEDLQSMSREDVFANVIAGFQSMEDSTERAALANDLFGKSGQELTPLFNSSIEETNEMRKAANELGFVLSDDAVKASADFNDALDTLKRTVGGIKGQFLQNFLPAASKVMDGLTAIFGGDSKSGVGKIKEGISEIIDKLSAKIPEFLDIGWSIVESLLTAIADNLPQLIEKGADILLNGVIPGILENLPELVETAFVIIEQLATSIGESLPELIPAAIGVILQIVESLLDNIDLLIDAAISLIMGLAEGIIQAIPILIEKAPVIVAKLVEAIIRNVPKLFEAAKEIIVKLWESLKENVPKLFESASEIVNTIGDGIARLWDTVKDWGKDLIDKIWNGVKSTWKTVKDWGRDIIDKIWDGLKNTINDATQWGKDLISNFWNGIKSKLDWLWDGVKSIGQGIADFLGFSEPKKGPLSNFHTFAPDMMELFMKGIRDNEGKLTDTVAEAFDFRDLMSGPEMAFVGSSAKSFGSGFGTINLYIDGDKLVGATSERMDRNLGQMQTIRARWGGVTE